LNLTESDYQHDQTPCLYNQDLNFKEPSPIEDAPASASIDTVDEYGEAWDHIQELREVIQNLSIDMESAGIDPDNPDPLDDSAVDQSDYYHTLQDDLKEAEKARNDSIQMVLPFGDDLETGAPLGKDVKTRTPHHSDGGARSRRFALQDTVKKLLLDLHPTDHQQHAIGHCYRTQQSTAAVNVVFSKKHKNTHYKNLQTCGNVWICPVCAAQVAENRKGELKKAIQIHVQNGGGVYLATYTVPHKREDDLKDMFLRFKDARQRFKRGAPMTRIKDRFYWKWSITATEITYGQNGWHPHTHEVIFLNKPWFGQRKATGELYKTEGEFIIDFREKIYGRWRRFAEKCGFDSPSRDHGVDIQNAEFAGNYVAKWGDDKNEASKKWEIYDEVTKAHIKTGKGKGRTPFDLIRSFQDGDKYAGKLFVEFARVFKGSRQLSWSRGMKLHFNIQEFSDEELVKRQEDEGIVLGAFDREQWNIVRRHKNLRADVLYAGLSGGWPAILSLIRRYEKLERNMSIGDGSAGYQRVH
jgi:hypothetical protein